jgi:hypothetical protein
MTSMSDEKKSKDELVVKAASVTVKRQVGAGMAYVDVAQGQPVGDVDDETRERLLASGAIGKADDAAYVAAARPVPGEVEPDEIDKDVIPAGSVEQILGWVGDDLARARVAREMEEAKGPKARATLLAKLDEVKQSLESEPPAVPEAYDPNTQPVPAGGVVTPVDDSAVDGKTADEAPASAPSRARNRS